MVSVRATVPVTLAKVEAASALATMDTLLELTILVAWPSVLIATRVKRELNTPQQTAMAVSTDVTHARRERYASEPPKLSHSRITGRVLRLMTIYMTAGLITARVGTIQLVRTDTTAQHARPASLVGPYLVANASIAPTGQEVQHYGL